MLNFTVNPSEVSCGGLRASSSRNEAFHNVIPTLQNVIENVHDVWICSLLGQCLPKIIVRQIMNPYSFKVLWRRLERRFLKGIKTLVAQVVTVYYLMDLAGGLMAHGKHFLKVCSVLGFL